MSKEYYDDIEVRFEEKTKEMLKELPHFVRGFSESMKGKSRKAKTTFAYVNDVRGFLLYEAAQLKVPVRKITTDDLSLLTTEDIEEYRRFLKKERRLKDASLKRMFVSLSLFFKYLTSRELIRKNPMDAFEAPEQKRKTKQRVIKLDSDLSSLLLNGILRNDKMKSPWFEFKGDKYRDTETVIRVSELKQNDVEDYMKTHPKASKADAVSALSGFPVTEGYDIIDMPDEAREKREKTVLRNYAIVRLFLSSGLRVSELVGLDLKDIRWASGSVIVVAKGGDEREVFFGPEAGSALSAYVYGEGNEGRSGRMGLAPKRGCDALFVSTWGTRMSVSSVEKLIKELAQTYLPDYEDRDIFSPHKLRATCATRILSQTGDIEMVATQLGNGIAVASEFYARLKREEKMKKNQELSEDNW